MGNSTDSSPGTRGDLLARTRERLARAGIESAHREAVWLVTEALAIDRAELVGWPESPVREERVGLVDAWTDRRVEREPIQYIVGYTEFHGHRIEVDPSVLIPRPETEELVSVVLDRMPAGPVRVLDCGTGSGCIAATIALARADAEVTAVDVSGAALATARSNADRLGARVRFVEADMLAPGFVAEVGGPFDVIVSNPPYVSEDEAATLAAEVVRHEPHVALFSSDDPIRFYRVLATLAAGRLGIGGTLLAVEVHADRGDAVCRVFEHAGLARVETTRDAAGRDRICTGYRSSS